MSDLSSATTGWRRGLPHKRTWQVFLVLSALALFLSGSFGAAGPRAAEAQTGWTLAWSDEFNGTGAPSSANWNYHVGNGWNPGQPGFAGWGNGEWEWYRPEQCTQQNGNLVIRATWADAPTNIGGRDWYQRSCRITTDTKRSFTYGRIEARIQMPNADGSWPAFWMMGDACDDTSTGNYSAPIGYYDTMASNWASCGEVDIMEHKNSDTTVVNNIFWDVRTGLFPWTAGQNANYAAYPNAGNVNAYHVYAIEWDQNFIRWFVDGTKTHEIDIRPGTLEEFRKPFHIILNLALGGAFPGMNPNKAQFPLTMSVDYVRYYTAGGSNPTPTPQPTAQPTTPPGCTTFQQGVSNVSSSQALVWFKPCGWTANYVILHYTRPGLPQQNLNMTWNSGAGRWEYAVTGITGGQTLQYQFTYNRSGTQYDSSW
ncbi:MAG TPA: glycoside hydrolase family 16 protein, partial [Herpetosiphonaceae bacterium]